MGVLEDVLGQIPAPDASKAAGEKAGAAKPKAKAAAKPAEEKPAEKKADEKPAEETPGEGEAEETPAEGKKSAHQYGDQFKEHFGERP